MQIIRNIPFFKHDSFGTPPEPPIFRHMNAFLQRHNLFYCFSGRKNKFYIVVFKNHADITNGHFTAFAQTIPVIYNTNVISADFLFFLLRLRTAKPQNSSF
jgi:hypothetical protein